MSETRLIPHIRYHNPYGGHPILRRSGRAAYAAVQEFLAACTDFESWSSARLSESPNGGKFLPSERHIGLAIIALNKALLPYRSPGSIINPETGESSDQNDWPFPIEHHDWAVEFSLRAPKAERGCPDPVWYSCLCDFRLKAPPNGPVLVGQDDRLTDMTGVRVRSSLHMHVSAGNTSAFFNLVFPFAEPGPEFVAYVAAIRPFLPIRLAKGNFKHWTLNRAGTDYRIRRIDKSLFDGI